MLATGHLKQEERNFTLGILKAYRELPALWEVGNKLYNDRKKKSEAYDILLSKYQEKYPTATKLDVRKKINSLRTNFRKELKRSIHDSNYIPNLWYFQDITFLTGVVNLDTSRQSICKVEATPSEAEEDECEEVTEEGEYKDVDPSKARVGNVFVLKGPIRNLKFTDDAHVTNKQQEVIEPEEASDNVGEVIQWTCQQPHETQTASTKAAEECKQIALVWAADLAKANPIQQMFAKKAISDILFEAQMGTLHRHSVQINQYQENDEES